MGGGGGRNAFSADNRVTATNDAARSLSSDVIAPFRFRRLSVDSIKAILEEEVGAVLIVSRSIAKRRRWFLFFSWKCRFLEAAKRRYTAE